MGDMNADPRVFATFRLLNPELRVQRAGGRGGLDPAQAHRSTEGHDARANILDGVGLFAQILHHNLRLERGWNAGAKEKDRGKAADFGIGAGGPKAGGNRCTMRPVLGKDPLGTCASRQDGLRLSGRREAP